jgi:spermidine synthase
MKIDKIHKHNFWLSEKLTDGELYRNKIIELTHESISKFQNIRILKFLNGNKVLFLDNQLQLASSDEFIYHESLIHVPFVTHQNPESVLIMGGGDGAAAREALLWKTVKKINLIEIDAEVINSCQFHFQEINQGVFDNSRVSVEINDVREFLKTKDKKFDIIIYDLSDKEFDDNHLINHDFLKKCKNMMNENGIMCLQSGSLPLESNANFQNFLNLLKSEFNFLKLYPVWVPSYSGFWLFIMLYNEVKKTSFEDSVNIFQNKISKELKFLNENTYFGMLNTTRFVQNYED